MMGWRASTACLAAALAVLPRSPLAAADVFDVRPGYWEAVWSYPDKTTARLFTCMTAEELEAMRFFAPREKGCTVLAGAQSRTHYDATVVCLENGERTRVRWLFDARDRMSYTASATSVVDGKNVSATASFRWLQESCSAAPIPIS